MTCASCAVSVASILKNTEGVLDASVNYGNQTAQVEWDSSLINLQGIQNAVRSIGYDLVIDSENAEEIQEQAQKNSYESLKINTIWATIFTIPVVIIGMFLMDMPYGNWISLVLTTPVLFYFGKHFFVNAWKKLLHKTANMDTLVALSTGIAFIFSTFNTIYPEFWHQRGVHAHVYFETATVIIVFISLGKLLEERAKSTTSSALKKLMGLQPKNVKILVGNTEKEIPISQVQVDDIILVRPGEKIAVDGIIVEGHSFVDESMISGEPVALEKQVNDQIFSGTINQKGSFKFKAQKVGSDTLLAQIIKTVQEAQGSKAPVQRLVDQIAGIFVPVVLGIAILTFLIWLWLGGENAFTHALLNAITVLVIACPCALGLATPTAIIVGVGKGAENNILIKDAESLEIGHKVNTVILDKTGTITEGKPEVSDWLWVDLEAARKPLLDILYSLENHSEHPLAEALIQKCKSEHAELITLDQIESITGKGIKANVGQEVYGVGNKAFISEAQISTELASWANARQQEAQTVVYFFNSKKILATIAIADKVKASSKEAIDELLRKGIEVYMFTGDNTQTAASVARQVGIVHYKAEALPADKAAFVKELQAQGKIVAMVGDGINDSEALALADLSIAMGKGSDIAMDVAKLTLITSDLRAVPKALLLSKKIVAGIRQNLFWAFIYNLIGIPIAAGVLYPVNGFLLNPMIAGAAMALSSVSVVANSLRLKMLKL